MQVAGCELGAASFSLECRGDSRQEAVSGIYCRECLARAKATGSRVTEEPKDCLVLLCNELKREFLERR